MIDNQVGPEDPMDRDRGKGGSKSSRGVTGRSFRDKGRGGSI